MGRLLRSLLALLARGLRTVAGRLSPGDAAPTTAVDTPTHDDGGGPPGHWLEMVRRRAPGLHVSLQERGVTAPRPAARPATVSPPRPGALEPRQRMTTAAPRTLAVAAPAAPRTLAPPVAETAAMRTRDPQSDLEPHGWQPNATATLTDAEEWTRAPTRRADAPIHPPRTTHPTRTDDAVLPLARPLTPADAVVAAAWRAARVGASEPLTEPAARIPVEPAVRPPTSGGLRAMPLAVVPATARHSLATPRFAPARDEDAAIPPLRQARRSYPTPAPTPWRVEALQAPPDVDLTALSTATAAPVDGHPAARFPALPDEAPARPAPRRVGVSTPPPAPARAPLAPPRPRHDSSDLAGAWPLLPGTRIPALRHAPGETERWPTLDDEPMRDDDGDELLSPAGHRERLAREQRGTPWNG